MPLSPSLLTEPNSNENLTSFTVTPALIWNEEFTELLLSSSTGKEIEHCKDKNIEIYLETGPNGTAENPGGQHGGVEVTVESGVPYFQCLVAKVIR